MAALLVLVVAVAGYATLVPRMTGNRFAVAPVGLFAALAVVRVLRGPTRWVAVGVLIALGDAVIAAAFPFRDGVLVWSASCALGAVVGLAAELMSPTPRLPTPGTSLPDPLDRASLHAWAIGYGVPEADLDLAGARPDDPRTYAVENVGGRWRAVRPGRGRTGRGSTEHGKPCGPWRTEESRACADLASSLAYHYR